MERLRKEVKVGSVKRIVSSLSLDGKRLTAEIDIDFVRELGHATAEAIGDQVFAIVDGILGEQIVQSHVHLKPSTIEDMVYARLGSTAGKVEQVRVHRLRTAQPETPASRPQGATHARAVPPPLPQTRVTPPAFPRARATPPPFPAQGARTAPPTSAPSSGERRLSPGSSRAAHDDALTQSMVPSVKPRPSTRPPSRSSSRPAVRRSAPPPPSLPAAPGRARETLPAGAGREPEFARVIERMGPFCGRMIRDASAYALITVLGTAPGTVDKWTVFEGKGPARGLRQEAAACFAGAVYLAARSAGAAHKDAVALVNVASRSAALAEVPTPADVSRYISSKSLSAELAVRLAELLGGDTEPSLFTTALGGCLETVATRLREALRQGE